MVHRVDKGVGRYLKIARISDARAAAALVERILKSILINAAIVPKNIVGDDIVEIAASVKDEAAWISRCEIIPVDDILLSQEHREGVSNGGQDIPRLGNREGVC